ncbi:MAG: hypothetical protein GX485_05705 [Clostridiales bacterium]|nr:hypothetical protein [Clostridiales bacterium]
MTRREILEGMFQKYGEAVSIRGNSVNAVLRPLQYKSNASLNLPTDYYDNLHYLYTGPAEHKLCIGDQIQGAVRNYVVKRADVAMMGGEELYVWAVLKMLAADADREVCLEADGKRAAVADRYTVKCIQQSRAVSAWGEQEPVDTVQGRITYELTVENVRPIGGIDLCALTNFNLIAVGNGVRTVYSGCRWKDIAASGGAGNTLCSSMVLVAAARTLVKEVQENG